MTTTAPVPERYRDRFTDTARAAWRAASWRAGLTGSWTHTPPPAAVALLAELARTPGPVAGSALARRAGTTQGRATSVHLPRLAAMGLVTSTEAPPARLWTITARGAELARTLNAEVTP